MFCRTSRPRQGNNTLTASSQDPHTLLTSNSVTACTYAATSHGLVLKRSAFALLTGALLMICPYHFPLSPCDKMFLVTLSYPALPAPDPMCPAEVSSRKSVGNMSRGDTRFPVKDRPVSDGMEDLTFMWLRSVGHRAEILRCLHI